MDHLCVNPIHRIGSIHKRSIDSCYLKWSVQVNVLLKICKQNIKSLSLLVGTTVILLFYVDLTVNKRTVL